MLQRLAVSANRHFLVREDGTPFFWLGDTAWELFHRLTLAEAERYLRRRAQQGFTLIQAVALAEFDGLRTPNRAGLLPFADLDPARPQEEYFAYVDAMLQLAADAGLYVGLLPTWGDKVLPLWGVGPQVFTPETAYGYGRYLATRYQRHPHLVWMLGGDRPVTLGDHDTAPVWRALAAGIRSVLGWRALLSYHPNDGAGSSDMLQDEDWLDLHLWQSGHKAPDQPIWDLIAHDYALRPPRPVLDAEPNYEDHPIDPFTRAWEPAFGRFRAYDVRKQAYRAVFAGACGHTYGHHSVWQFYSLEREPINWPAPTWEAALERPGARQLLHLRRLLESRPFLTRIPDQTLLLSDPEAGQGGRQVCATRDARGSYACVYIPTAGQTVTLALDRLGAARLRAWLYSPRTGEATELGTLAGTGSWSFTTPERAPGAPDDGRDVAGNDASDDGPDWVLALDDVTAGFGPPGQAPHP